MLLQENLENDSVYLIVATVERDRADPLRALTEPIHATFTLLMPGGIPREIVVDHSLEVRLQVHALGEAVGCDQDMPAGRRGEFVDAGDAFVRRQGSGDSANDDILSQRLVQLLRNILGRVDESAEDDGGATLREQSLDFFHQNRDLTIRLSFELACVGHEAPQLSRRGVLLTLPGIGTRSRVQCFDGLVVGLVEHDGTPEGISFFSGVRSRRCRPGPQRLGGSPRR